MQQKNTQLVNRLQLCMQRALLGAITPNIRAILAELIKNKIKIYFYYDGEIQDDDEENASIVTSEIIADFDDEFDIDLIIKQIDYPIDIVHPIGICVYYRKEGH
ncbi:hypothetical protein [Providencia burhodogranariea]|uniref:Uncharacterized protein n=1 Tax=Providencia burhodogranariea DSM 19968 TaxID=1141662 RepID=K8WWX2_9GAMM|nr:hypothetical protein [Providencia burhodogranariea]EKT65113.1 hypothetical protein OOA_01220 [Providencia burhodogranariea DSM 19968]